MRRLLLMFIVTLLLLACFLNKRSYPQTDPNPVRMELFKRVQAATNIPWYYLAAVDQYERNIRSSRRDIPKQTGVIGIYIRPEDLVRYLKSQS